MKLTETGSLINYLQGNTANNAPVVGEGATYLSWSDRHAYTVVSVSEDGLTCEIVRDNAIRVDSRGMSDAQNYTYQRGED